METPFLGDPSSVHLPLHRARPRRGRPPLGFLALLLPVRDRERFAGEVLAELADRRRWWQRIEEPLFVAGALPGLAVILRWARRRWA